MSPILFTFLCLALSISNVAMDGSNEGTAATDGQQIDGNKKNNKDGIADEFHTRMSEVKEEMGTFLIEMGKFERIKKSGGELPFFTFYNLVSSLMPPHKTGSLFAFKLLSEVEGAPQPIVALAKWIYDEVRGNIEDAMTDFIDHFESVKTKMSKEVKTVLTRAIHPDTLRIELYQKEMVLKRLGVIMATLVKSLDELLGLKLERFKHSLQIDGDELGMNLQNMKLQLTKGEMKKATTEYAKFEQEFIANFRIGRGDKLLERIEKAYVHFRQKYLVKNHH